MADNNTPTYDKAVAQMVTDTIGTITYTFAQLESVLDDRRRKDAVWFKDKYVHDLRYRGDQYNHGTVDDVYVINRCRTVLMESVDTIGLLLETLGRRDCL